MKTCSTSEAPTDIDTVELKLSFTTKFILYVITNTLGAILTLLSGLLTKTKTTSYHSHLNVIFMLASTQHLRGVIAKWLQYGKKELNIKGAGIPKILTFLFLEFLYRKLVTIM